MIRISYLYRFGTAEFDESRFELRIAGLPVEVEPRALAVLAYLLEHAGEVVTKEELLAEVWAGRITVDKVLPNAVNKLRRALGEANADYITTLARVGYRLDGKVTRTPSGNRPLGTMAFEPGQALLARPNFLLLRQMAVGAGREIWLAEHQKTGERRVYKFALNLVQLRALKREVTLLRVLQDTLDNTSHFTEVIDWNFESEPYFLECRYGGPDLAEWASTHLSELTPPARIGLFLQVADSVAAAHAVGVLHKDLKPSNILVSGGAEDPFVRLNDFGSGHLLEPDRLKQLGITRMGLTIEGSEAPDPTSGTPFYMAPECFEGHSPTMKTDVFALGILLYQLMSGRIGQPMASGWETTIDDPLLCEDLRLATEGDPKRRLGSVSDLADRLRRLEARRLERRGRELAMEAAKRDSEAIARVRMRRPYELAIVFALAVGAVTAVWLQQRAAVARDEAREELGRANALAGFINEDLIGRSNPLVSAKGPETTLREVLLSARGRMSARFVDQPLAAAEVRSNLAAMFMSIDMQSEAQQEASAALDLLERNGGLTSPAAFRTRLILVNILCLQGRFDEAQRQFESLQQLASSAPQGPTALMRSQIAAARSALLIGRGEFVEAVSQLRVAVMESDAAEPGNTRRRDTLRLDLISTLALANDFANARVEGERLIEEAKRRSGDNELLIAMARMAMVRALGEDRDTSEKLLLDAKPVIESRLGRGHKRYLFLTNELHRIALEQGEWREALAYAEEAYQLATAKHSEDDPVANSVLLNWARALSEAGRSAEAVEKVRTAHENLQRVFGPKGPRTQLAAVIRAQIELDAGNTEQALAVIEEIDVTVLKAGHAIDIWDAIRDALRGIALQQIGDEDAAKPLLESAMVELKKGETWEQPTRLFLMTERALSTLQ